MSNYKATLEYKKKNDETPFETFLKYTDEKDKSSTVLAELLRKNTPNKKINFLDIGTGTGEYLEMTLRKSKLSNEIDFVLLEPSGDLVKELKNKVSNLQNKSRLKIIKKTWESYQSDQKFDLILASHLYHIKRENYHEQLVKMVNYLSNDGVLLFVLRNVDDLYDFKMRFKPKLFGKEYKAQTLDQVVKVFRNISKNDNRLTINRYESVSHLWLPFKKNMPDTIALIEFCLNKYWDDIPEILQAEILAYVKKKRGVFRQVDGIAVVRKV